MTDLLKDLEAVALLAEKATPGPWHRHTDCPGKCCWHVFTAPDGIYGPETDNAGNSSLINSPEMAEEDASYIVALSNFLRTHHAEIAEAVRDARRLDWLESEANTRGGLLLHDGSESGRRGLGLGFRDLRTAIDQCMSAIDAQHNSAREGQG